MPLARTHAAALVGVSGHPVVIEADVGQGLPALHLIGLPDTALREAGDRVRAAVVNSDQEWPNRRITVSLSPASLPKRGSLFDLGIAMALLGAVGAFPREAVADRAFFGELALDGTVRAVCGVLPAVVAVAKHGIGTVVVPRANAPEAALVPDVTVVAATTLADLVAWLAEDRLPSWSHGARTSPGEPGEPHAGAGTYQQRQNGDRTDGAMYQQRPNADLADVAGQPFARHALEVSAAGGHHLWLLGPPGGGKTMLAERLPTLLPPLDREAALEVTAIHSVAGTLPPGRPLISEPPFCNPHHTSTVAAIVGGGSSVLRPGSVSLAHHGVLFLDEAPEFATKVLDALRQPLESHEVVIARSAATVRFPARFLLVLAANPCPCAAAGAGDDCRCTPLVRRRYLGRLSGPLLDRVDLKVQLRPVSRRELLADLQLAETSEVVAKRVLLARERAAARLAGTPWRLNAEVPGAELRRRFVPAPEAVAPLHRALDRGTLSARGVDRVLRVAWTLADLADKPRPGVQETGLALALWQGLAA